jgi:DNA repair protein RadA/Sms
MGARRSHFECQQCGYQAPRWLGRCPDCGAWGSLTETAAPAAGPGRGRDRAAPGAAPPVLLSDVPGFAHRRVPTGIGEFDRVLGGGLVPGGVVLFGGDPGVGKSTLLLQAAGALARRELAVLYVSGEESLAQMSERGRRLGADVPGLYLAAETSLEAVLEQIVGLKPALVIVDSIQTVWTTPSSLPRAASVRCARWPDA